MPECQSVATDGSDAMASLLGDVIAAQKRKSWDASGNPKAMS